MEKETSFGSIVLPVKWWSFCRLIESKTIPYKGGLYTRIQGETKETNDAKQIQRYQPSAERRSILELNKLLSISLKSRNSSFFS